MLRFVALFVIFACLTSCGQDSTSSSHPTHQTLSLNLFTDPVSLEPHLAWDSASSICVQQLFEGLTRIAQNGEPQPAAASEIEVSPDKRTYVFHLRNSVWSNGDPVTSADFVRSWSSQLLPDATAPMAEQLYVIKNAQAIRQKKKEPSELGLYAPDEKTLVVALENPTPYFLDLIATASFLPSHQDSTVSNGPFILESWKHSDSVVMQRNPTFWDAANVKLDAIFWMIVGDPSTELRLFQNGELDWAGGPLSYLPTDAIPALMAAGQLQVRPRAAVYYYLLNTRIPVLKNAALRKALALAVDREAIVKHILQSGEKPATNLIPPVISGKSVSYFPAHDPEKARIMLDRALTELGMTVADIPALTLSYNSSETHEMIAEAIQEQWRTVLGIHVTLKNEEWKVYLDHLKAGDFTIARMGYNAHVADPLILLDIFHDAQAAENYTGWEDTAYIDLVEAIRTTSDPEKRAALVEEADQLLMDAMPIIPIYHYANVFVKNPQLEGVSLNKVGLPDFRWAYKKSID